MSRRARRALTLALALAAAAPAARAFEPWVRQWGVVGLDRGPATAYYGTVTEAGSPLGKTGMYGISARVKEFRARDFMTRNQLEYSAALERQLFHVTVLGRLGTNPPNAQGLAYHLAGGEVWLDFYGLTVGPRDVRMSPAVWESTTPAPSPNDFATTWVSEVHTIYINSDYHLQLPTQEFIVVQNSWQFEVRETWRKTTSAAFEMGFHRYNKVLPDSFPKFFLNNVDYPGGDFAIATWPNNFVSGELRQRVAERWVFWGAATRLNSLDNQVNFLYGAGLEWAARKGPSLSLDYSYNRRRNTSVRRGVGLGVSYRW